jgi:hypothetical protein
MAEAAAAPVPPSAQPAAEMASEEASSPAAAASPAVSSPAASSPAQLAQLSLDSTWAEAFPPEVRSKMLEAATAPSSPGSADGSRARLLALYEHGKQEGRRRRESSGRSALEQGCTFKPEISSKAKRLGRGAPAPSSPPPPPGDGGGGDAGAVGAGTGTCTGAGTSTSSSSVFESLYASARTAQHKQEEARRAALERSAPSFKPSINKVSKKELDKAAAVSRFEALYASAVTHQRELKKRQETARDAECTFEPRVNATPGHGKAGAGGRTGPERLEELYKHARVAEEKRRQQQENSLRQLTFRPAINKASADKYSRGGDIAKMCPEPAEIKSKQARLEEIRLAREMQGCTFAPRVSAQPGAEPARRAAGDVHSRLYEHAKQRAAELAQQLQDSLAVPPQHPDLSLTQGAAATASNSSSSSSSSSARAAAHEHEQQRTPASGEAPASPASSARSARTGASARSAGKVVTAETLKTFARLYREGKESTARKLKEEREGAARRSSSEWERNRSECTFTPSIPDASRALAERSRPPAAAAQDIFERLHAESSAKLLQREIEAQDRLGLDLACTFSPRISDSSKELLKRRSEQRRRSADGAQGARLKSAAAKGLLPNDAELANGWAGAEAGGEPDHVAPAAVTSPQRKAAALDDCQRLLLREAADAVTSPQREAAALDDCQRLLLREAADLDAQDLQLAAARRASWGH